MKGFYTLGAAALLTATMGVVCAHTQNAATLFSDITTSEVQDDIVLLAAVGIIPETRQFEPEAKLSKHVLASWVALAYGLGVGGEHPDIDALSNAAIKQGLLTSLDGLANYADINNALFSGELSVHHPGDIPSKAEAAKFVANNLDTVTNDTTLLTRKAMKKGPTGEVEFVESRMNIDGSKSYFITIWHETYPFYAHGKLSNGPEELDKWVGHQIKKSIVRDLNGLTVLIYLQAEDNYHAVNKHSGDHSQLPAHGVHSEHMHDVSVSSDDIAGIHIPMMTGQGHYQVSVKSEFKPLVINRIHSWTLHLETASGEPVADAQITVDGGMPAHNHGLPTAPEVTEYLGEGDYLVEGLMFQMPGHWQVSFDISADAVSDSVTFDFVLE